MKSVYTDRYSSFLSLIIAARKEAHVTQQELAEQLGKPQSYVSKYERGERRLDVIEFLDIVEALGVDPRPLLEELQAVRPKKGGA